MRYPGEFDEGSLYRVTYNGVKEVALYRGDGYDFPWRPLRDGEASQLLHRNDVTNVTGPLRVLNPDERVVEPGQVVLDLDALGWVSPGSKEALCDNLRGDGYILLSEAIAEQTAPPRIAEPGMWGVVIDPNANIWVRCNTQGAGWFCAGARVAWSDWQGIENPTLVRDGVES